MVVGVRRIFNLEEVGLDFDCFRSIICLFINYFLQMLEGSEIIIGFLLKISRYKYFCELRTAAWKMRILDEIKYSEN